MSILASVWRVVLAALTAGTEGVRLIVRRPGTVLVWVAVWVIALTLVSLLKLAAGGVASIASTGRRDVQWLAKGFGPLAIVLVPTILVLWMATTAAVYRTVLRPDERSWFSIRLGLDELRLGFMTAMPFLLTLLLGGVPAYLLFVLLNPVMAAVPGLVRVIGTIGSVLTICIEIWVGARLSLIAVETFAEKRLHFTAYWPITRGHFWLILLSYVVVFFQLALFAMAASYCGPILLGLGESLQQHPQSGDAVHRGLLLALAGSYAALFALLFVVPIVSIGACQSRVFKMIYDPTRSTG